LAITEIPARSNREIIYHMEIREQIKKKLLLKRLKPIIEARQLIPEHQFGFRNEHSTTEQVHLVKNVINNVINLSAKLALVVNNREPFMLSNTKITKPSQ